MMEEILSIKEVNNISFSDMDISGIFGAEVQSLLGYGSYDGYEILTDKQDIYVLISNYQQCCESWGYIASSDDLHGFEGAILFDVSIVDVGLNSHMVEAGNFLDSGEIMFVNFRTSMGYFQLACYNAQNGYYGHDAYVLSEQLFESRYV